MIAGPTMLAAAIDWGALLKMLYASVAAGVGVAIVFSLAILGAVRSIDLRRAERMTAANAYVVLAAVSLTITAAIVVVGVVLVAHK